MKNIEEVRGEPRHLVAGQHHVAHQRTDDACRREEERPRDEDDEGARPDGAADEADELVEPERLGPHGVDHHVRSALPVGQGEPGEVLHVDRLEPVSAGGDAEHGQAPQEPGDVVHEHVASPEEDRGPQDRAGEARLAERRLRLRLPAEVGERGIRRRVRDRDVDHALHAGVGRGAEQRAAVRDRAGKRGSAVIEARPVGVVEHPHVAEGGAHRGRLVEPERDHLHAPREGIGPARVTGEASHALAPLEEEPGEVHAAVTERPRDGVGRASHGMSSLVRCCVQNLLNLPGAGEAAPRPALPPINPSASACLRTACPR